MARLDTARSLIWPRVLAALIVCGLVVFAWIWAPRSIDLQEFEASFAPHRGAWYALPAVILAFIGLGLAMVSVMLLVATTGIVFGPVLGPVYAMAGCLASASTGFAIGRWLGPRRVEHLGGARLSRVVAALRRNGVLAVFVIRKVPAPFTIVNVVVGASTVSYRDFIVGTALAMAAGVVALAGFGFQILNAIQHPSPRTFFVAALFVGVPLLLALTINHTLRRPRATA